MQEICAEAGLSPGALYRYFPSKAELIIAIAELNSEMARAPIDALDKMLPFRERLRLLAEAYFDRVARKDRALAAEVLAEAVRDKALGARLAATEAPLRQALAAFVREAQRRGEADPAIDSEQAARLLIAALNAAATRLIVFQSDDAGSALQDFMTLFHRFFAPTAGLTRASQRELESVS